MVIENREKFRRDGMAISAVKLDATAVDVTVTDDQILVVLADGRELARLLHGRRVLPRRAADNARIGA